MRLDWDGVEEAFESHRSGSHAYVDLESGEVVWWSDVLAAEQQEAVLRRLSDEPDRYLRVEPLPHGKLWQWMSDFTESISEPRLRFRVAEALQLRGVFRKFRNVMDEHPDERERWFAFKQERLRREIDGWVHTHGLLSDNPSPWEEDAAPAGSFSDAVEEGIRIGLLLQDQKRQHEAIGHLLRLASDHPGSSRAHLHLAFALDREGREKEAIPQYEQAIILGLRNDDLHEACVCLGSSWREVGDPARAISVLDEALARFPGDPVLTMFAALALHDQGQNDKAISKLGSLLLGTPFSVERRWQATIRQKLTGLARRKR